MNDAKVSGLIFFSEIPRLKPGMESRTVAEIESELKCNLRKVSWLPDFYAIPPEIQIAGSKAYQQGKVRRNLCYNYFEASLLPRDRKSVV